LHGGGGDPLLRPDHGGADVFTGITEDRPYRAGMPEAERWRVIRGDGREERARREARRAAPGQYGEINRARTEAQGRAVREYENFREALGHAP